jgi:hypothetical protein
VNGGAPEWYSEEMRFSEFILKNLAWQRASKALHVNDALRLWPYFAGAIAFVAAIRLARRLQWRQIASALYAHNVAGWQGQRAWTAVASRDPEPWRAGGADAARRALEGLDFSFAGWIQNATFPLGAIHATQIGMTVFFGDEGTIWAASYEASGHEVVEFESEFADGLVLSTGNNELAGRLAWPPSFDVLQQPFDSDPSAFLTLHRERIAARLRARPEAVLVRCATVEDVLLSQERQRAVKRPFRQSVDFMTEEEFGDLARLSRLSRAAAKGIYAEYRRVAREAREARNVPSLGGAPRDEVDEPRTHRLITEALEFHDSSLSTLSLSGGDAILELEQAYVHRWERDGDHWLGKGWIKPVRIRLTGAFPGTSTPALPADISEGTLTVAGVAHANLVPLPYEAQGDIRLRLLLVDSESLEIQGTGVAIDVIGRGQPVEDLPPEWAPGENDGRY